MMVITFLYLFISAFLLLCQRRKFKRYLKVGIVMQWLICKMVSNNNNNNNTNGFHLYKAVFIQESQSATEPVNSYNYKWDELMVVASDIYLISATKP